MIAKTIDGNMLPKREGSEREAKDPRTRETYLAGVMVYKRSRWRCRETGTEGREGQERRRLNPERKGVTWERGDGAQPRIAMPDFEDKEW